MIIAAITSLWQFFAIAALAVLFAWSVNLLQRARESFSTSQMVVGYLLMAVLIGSLVAIA